MWWGGEWPRAAGSSGCVANFCDPRDWTAGGGGFDLSPLLADCRKQEQVHLTLGCHLLYFTGRWEVADSWLQAYPAQGKISSSDASRLDPGRHGPNPAWTPMHNPYIG